MEQGVSSFDLGSPLYLAWQLTNECNLACLHCIEESGPGKRMPDEMSEAQCRSILEQVIAAQIPYVAFSGGEPMLHPAFFELAESVCGRGIELKVETNGVLLDAPRCARLGRAGVKSVQVSMDGVTQDSYGRLRAGGRLDDVLGGLRRLREAGVTTEVNFSPTRCNAGEVGKAVDLAFECGASAFFTGRTMYTGNAVRSWDRIAPTEEQYAGYFRVLHEKSAEYGDRMRICFHEMGLLAELKCRLEHPAALLIVLPNGLVKLINALPFVCGDLREQTLLAVWEHFKTAWRDPRVARFVADMEVRPELTSELHRWVRL
ncbi:MAG: hypothetical protein A2X36_10150 [Elusimicrobia bacterium GWA2_69_24]|nr:MAG: hypothetical protein A2X36_10150 [Elusimicrobia bacterium GWA2_69_24]HBL19199.1 hypothetical protein [Elusimicrobiota bacterium]